MPAVNRYIKSEDEKKKKKKGKVQMPSWMKKLAALKVRFGDDVALRYIPYVIFLTMLGLVYIANNHQAERLAGKITKLEREVKVLQMEYGTLKFEFMNRYDRAKISGELKEMGLYPNDKPIVKIVLED